MNLFFLPWNMGAQAVKDIKALIGGTSIYPETSKHCSHSYRFRPDHLVVLWGHGAKPYWGNGIGPKNPRILNHWDAIYNAVNKLRTFKVFEKSELEIPVPKWTSSRATAKEWVEAGNIVLCRQKLTSREGDGIVIAKEVGDVVEAPLYTMLVPKEDEYRVHVFRGEVIDYTQKKLRHDAKNIKGRDPYIRNTANGWVFCRQDVTISEACKKAAKNAAKALGLDIAAVDLATSKKNGKPVVFEVNTAPGIEGTTIKRYADAIKAWKEGF